MPYKCSKCDKEFLLKSRFRGHMRRKTPCTAQTSMDVFEKLIEVISTRAERCEGRSLSEDEMLYFENRLNDVTLFHGNLPEEDKVRAQNLYDECLKQFFTSRILVSTNELVNK